MRPLADWGGRVPDRTWGSNHVRYLVPSMTLRLTTNAASRSQQ